MTSYGFCVIADRPQDLRRMPAVVPASVVGKELPMIDLRADDAPLVTAASRAYTLLESLCLGNPADVTDQAEVLALLVAALKPIPVAHDA